MLKTFAKNLYITYGSVFKKKYGWVRCIHFLFIFSFLILDGPFSVLLLIPTHLEFQLRTNSGCHVGLLRRQRQWRYGRLIIHLKKKYFSPAGNVESEFCFII